MEIRKIYEVVPDRDASGEGMLRVIDESGEDYLFPKDWFVAVQPSAELLSALQIA